MSAASDRYCESGWKVPGSHSHDPTSISKPRCHILLCYEFDVALLKGLPPVPPPSPLIPIMHLDQICVTLLA